MQAESGAFWTRFSEMRISEVTGRWDKGREGREGTAHPSALDPSPPAVQHINGASLTSGRVNANCSSLAYEHRKLGPSSPTHIYIQNIQATRNCHTILFVGSQQRCRSPLLNCPRMVSRIMATSREEGSSTGPQLRSPSAHFSQEE